MFDAMRRVFVYSSVSLAFTLVRVDSGLAATVTVEISDHASISADGLGSRLLVDFGDLTVLQGKEILYAKAILNVGYDSCVESIEEVDVRALSRGWSMASVSWTYPWDSAGGDMLDGFSRTVSVGTGSGAIQEILLTELFQVWADGRFPNYGVALVARSPECVLYFVSTAASPVANYGKVVVKYVNRTP